MSFLFFTHSFEYLAQLRVVVVRTGATVKKSSYSRGCAWHKWMGWSPMRVQPEWSRWACCPGKLCRSYFRPKCWESMLATNIVRRQQWRRRLELLIVFLVVWVFRLMHSLRVGIGRFLGLDRIQRQGSEIGTEIVWYV